MDVPLLPPEVLAHIFEYLCPSAGIPPVSSSLPSTQFYTTSTALDFPTSSAFAALIRATSVCHAWRAASLSMPLWSVFPFGGSLGSDAFLWDVERLARVRRLVLEHVVEAPVSKRVSLARAEGRGVVVKKRSGDAFGGTTSSTGGVPDAIAQRMKPPSPASRLGKSSESIYLLEGSSEASHFEHSLLFGLLQRELKQLPQDSYIQNVLMGIPDLSLISEISFGSGFAIHPAVIISVIRLCPNVNAITFAFNRTSMNRSGSMSSAFARQDLHSLFLITNGSNNGGNTMISKDGFITNPLFRSPRSLRLVLHGPDAASTYNGFVDRSLKILAAAKEVALRTIIGPSAKQVLRSIELICPHCAPPGLHLSHLATVTVPYSLQRLVLHTRIADSSDRTPHTSMFGLGVPRPYLFAPFTNLTELFLNLPTRNLRATAVEFPPGPPHISREITFVHLLASIPHREKLVALQIAGGAPVWTEDDRAVEVHELAATPQDAGPSQPPTTVIHTLPSLLGDFCSLRKLILDPTTWHPLHLTSVLSALPDLSTLGLLRLRKYCRREIISAIWPITQLARLAFSTDQFQSIDTADSDIIDEPAVDGPVTNCGGGFELDWTVEGRILVDRIRSACDVFRKKDAHDAFRPAGLNINLRWNSDELGRWLIDS
ncbi:hypothetical protein BJ742DRAFT_174449 [Cladochytrium replicatum]|nr:hypothetical protein BJ742DRAFT_174449 [Cladochytrium replicatum]